MDLEILVAGELNVESVLQNPRSFPVLGRETLVEGVSLTVGSASAICASALAKLGEQVAFIGKALTPGRSLPEIAWRRGY